jgi:hypothetical protein
MRSIFTKVFGSRPGTARARRARLSLETLEKRDLLSVTVGIDAAAGQHAIDPRIYGVNIVDSQATIADTNIPFNRFGGNQPSRYNWQQNASNHGQDFFYESLADGPATPAGLTDNFINATRAGGGEPSIEIPMLGYVAKLNDPNGARGSNWSFSVNKYGPQQATDQDTPNPDAGNGIKPDGSYIVGNDPNDANVPEDANFMKGWVQHMVDTFGPTPAGNVKYYTLDNEPGIWHDTHRDVHPQGETMDEIVNDITSYATMIKSVDPNAKTLGPEEYGWFGYFNDGHDKIIADNGGMGGPTDRSTHGNMDYLPYVLDTLHQQDVATGKRLLDYLTVHYYPQGSRANGADEFSDNVDPTTELLRNRSTRSLWDPNYVDQSWMGEVGINNGIVQLIPLLKSWINQYYPGTGLGITEYTWGAPKAMNGATAQADVLGIFGSQGGVDLANYFPLHSGDPLPVDSPVCNVFKMYRNYDGMKSTFGDVSVKTTQADADIDHVSVFSSLRSADGALTVMVDNKDLPDANAPTTDVTLNLSNFANQGVVHLWNLVGTGAADPQGINNQPNEIQHLADVHFMGNSVTLSVPKQSVLLAVFDPAAAPNPQPPAVTHVAPSMGNPGDVITLTGTGFIGANAVHFGANAAANYTIVSDTQITATAPQGAAGSTVDVIVSNANGDSAISNADQFTYNNAPPAQPPAVTSVAPAMGNPGDVVTLTGTGFTGANAVHFGANAAANYTIVSDTQITATAPQGAAGSIVDVIVSSANGDSATSNADHFTYNNAPPPPQPGQLQFDVAQLTAAETDGNVTVQVDRANGSDGAVTVDYSTTVDNPENPIHASGTLSFAAGETSKRLSFPITHDQDVTGDLGYTLKLSNSGGGAAIGAPGSLSLTITDAEFPHVPDSPPSGRLPQAALVFARSREHYEDFITREYAQQLNRTPDAAGLDFWVGQMMNGSQSDERVEAQFIGSTEYIENHGGQGRSWVVGMYQSLLGRTPIDDEVQYWLSVLGAGTSTEDVALGFATSVEREAIHVRTNYQTYLGRDASQGEIDYWVGAFRIGFSNEDLVAGFVGSPEYFNNASKGHGNDAFWVIAAYRDVLFRAASRPEVDDWLRFLGAAV